MAKKKVDEKQNSASVGLLNEKFNEGIKMPKDKPPISRWHCLTTYIPFDTVKRYLQYCPYVKHWSIILHNKDLKENGEEKEPHTHILLYTFDAKSSSAVVKRFNNLAKQYALENGGEVQNTLGQLCYEPLAQFRYQLHLDDFDKHQYDTFERKTDDNCYWSDFERANGKSENKAVEIFDSIVDGASTRDLLVRFGCEYSHNFDKYKRLVAIANLESNQNSSDKNFNEMLKVLVGKLIDNGVFAQKTKDEFFECLSFVEAVLRNNYGLELTFQSI